MGGFPGGTVEKNPPANEGDTRDVCLKPGLGRPLEVGNGSPLQYFCLENSTDRGAWQLQSRGSENINMTDLAEIFWIIFAYQTCLLQIFSPGLWLFSFSS